MKWQILAGEPPSGEVLVWSAGRAVVAEIVPADETSAQPLCVDPRTDDILAWPTHWMKLPPPPDSLPE